MKKYPYENEIRINYYPIM